MDQSRSDQCIPGVDRRCKNTRNSEDQHTEGEHRPPTGAICNPTEHEQQRREYEGVGLLYPLRLRGRHSEVVDDARNGDIHNRGVHDDQRDTKGDKRKSEPASAITHALCSIRQARMPATIDSPITIKAITYAADRTGGYDAA